MTALLNATDAVRDAICIRGLVKRFPGFQLGPLDLTVPRGAIYGLIGPNAAGKTTIIDLMLGMGREEAGTIELLGLDHRRDEVSAKRRIGYVSPELNFTPWGKVHKLINFYRAFYPDWDDAYCRQLLERFQIGGFDKIAALSFGSRTKLAIVLALSHRPELLLLDEPTTGVDAAVKQDIFAELLEAVQSPERTVLISSHGLADIERFCDHIGMIKEGKLLFEGPTADLVARFQRIEFSLAETASRPKIEHCYYEAKSGDRCRAILDTTDGATEKLRGAGATDLAFSPVTLEEIFIAATRSQSA